MGSTISSFLSNKTISYDENCGEHDHGITGLVSPDDIDLIETSRLRARSPSPGRMRPPTEDSVDMSDILLVRTGTGQTPDHVAFVTQYPNGKKMVLESLPGECRERPNLSLWRICH